MSICIVVISKVINKSLYDKFKDSKYQVIFITDLPIHRNIHNVVYYNNKECDKRKFYGSGVNRGRGWDKCIRFIVENNKFDYYWILEDDVYFKNLYPKYYKSFNLDWPHFNKLNLKFFKKNVIKGSTSYICRISNNLVNKINKFKKKFKRLVFHEVLFASICGVFNLRVFRMLEEHSKYLNTMSKGDKIINILNNKDIIMYHPFKNWHMITDTSYDLKYLK